MRAVAIILASSEFISAFFLILKIHKDEMANFVIFFCLCICMLCNKNFEITIENLFKNLMPRISNEQNSKSVKKYDL